MREKLEQHGDRVFLTHELLEMMLYNMIPYRDTNPPAKLLLKKFGSLDGVLSADAEELMTVDGIGKRTAEMLSALGDFSDALFSNDGIRDEFVEFTDYANTGKYISKKIGTSDVPTVLLLLFNNRMELISEVVICNTDFASAAVRADAFVNAAVHFGAASVIIAHSHPYGAPYPTIGDIETNKPIVSALNRIGVSVVEHYIVTGKAFIGIMNHLNTSFFQDNTEGWGNDGE